MSNDLVYVLSKIQLGDITHSKFKDSSDAVKEALRKKYPSFGNQNEIRVVDIEMGPQGQKVQEKLIPMIVLTSAVKDWGIRISPDSIILHTNNYSNFDEFKERMEHVLEVVASAMDVAFTSFIGIRYINKIKPDADGGFPTFIRSEFLQPELSGLQKAGANLGAKYQTPDGWVNVNSGVTVNSGKLSRDLLEVATDLGETDVALEGPWAHLDVDSVFLPPNLLEYNKEEIMDKLTALRSHAKNIYGQIIHA